MRNIYIYDPPPSNPRSTYVNCQLTIEDVDWDLSRQGTLGLQPNGQERICKDDLPPHVVVRLIPCLSRLRLY